MTPLAMQIARRQIACEGKLSKYLEDACFFETSSVARDVESLIGPHGHWFMEKRFFLPKNPTWIEWKDRALGRVAVCLRYANDGCSVLVDEFRQSHPGLMRLTAKIDPSGTIRFPEKVSPYDGAAAVTSLAAVFLAFINTPRIIGRRIHMPHAGFQKELARQKGMVGKFPLQAWTEIKLEVTPPADETGKIAKNTILTGERALHFVRAHLRIRNGMLVRVSAHWRGNPAMGIKQTRFSVQPPKSGIWPTELRPQLSGQPA